MPYTASNLPENVKKLPTKKQRQWMHIFNGCMADGKPESKCFAMANGVAAKEFSELTLEDAELIFEAKAYQYVESYDYADRQLSQEEAGYDPLGSSNTQGCANCQWFVSPGRCTVVAGEISPTGLSSLWREKAAWTPAPVPVTIVKSLKDGGDPSEDDEEWILFADDEPEAFFGEKEELTSKKRNKLPKSSFAWVDEDGKGHLPIHDESHVRNAMARWNQTKFSSAGAKASAKSKIMAAARRFGIDASGFAKSKDTPSTDGSPGQGLLQGLRALVTRFGGTGSAPPPVQARAFTVVKQKDGRTRFYTVWSNNFKDREGEIFTAAAHKEFVDWATASGEYPELWLWHTKGSKFGQVDWLDYTGDGFVHASGLIDAGKEAIAEKLVEEDCGVSHGFVGLQQGNLIHWYRSYELSPLPLKNAAVWTTSFNLLDSGKATEMGFTPEKKQFFTNLGIPEEQIKAWEQQTDGLADALKALGLESKAADMGVAIEPPPTPEEVAEQNFRVETTKALMSLQEVVAGIATQMKELDERTKDIKSGDAVIAATMTPQASGAVTQASKSADNVVSQTEDPSNQAAKDFFQRTVLGSLIGEGR